MRVKLVIGCPIEKVFRKEVKESSVTKYYPDTGKPYEQKHNEVTIYFGEEVVVKPKNYYSRKRLIKEFLLKKKIFLWCDDSIIYNEFQTTYEYSCDKVDLEKLSIAKDSFRATLWEIGVAVEPDLYIMCERDYGD